MKRSVIGFGALIAGLFIITVLGVLIGTSGISPIELINSIIEEPGGRLATIVFSLRLPRTLTAMLAGGNLALGGAVMQGFFRNPMAEPYIVGVSSGAGLGAVLSVISGFSSLSIFFTPIFAFITALLVTTIVYLLSLKYGRSDVRTLLLAGIAVASFVGSITYLFLYLSLDDWNAGKKILYWMMGGLEARGFEHVLMILPFSMIGIVLAVRFARELNILSLGEDHSRALGISLERTRVMMISVSAFLTASSVSVAGMIGFVGLIVPHMMRLLFGADHRRLIPLSYLGGALFLTLVDIIVRLLTPHIQIRLGIITGLIGAPFFLYLLIKRRREMFI